jgi:hypothetical protein
MSRPSGRGIRSVPLGRFVGQIARNGRNTIKNVHLDLRHDRHFQAIAGVHLSPVAATVTGPGDDRSRCKRSTTPIKHGTPNPDLHDVRHPKVASAYIQDPERVASGRDRAVFPIKILHRYTDGCTQAVDPRLRSSSPLPGPSKTFTCTSVRTKQGNSQLDAIASLSQRRTSQGASLSKTITSKVPRVVLAALPGAWRSVRRHNVFQNGCLSSLAPHTSASYPIKKIHQSSRQPERRRPPNVLHGSRRRTIKKAHLTSRLYVQAPGAPVRLACSKPSQAVPHSP